MEDKAVEALVLAARAEEQAKAAHERLDRMNGSIDKLASQVGQTNGKIDTLTAALAHQTGVDEGEQSADERKRSITGIQIAAVSACGGVIAALTYLALLAAHIH